MSAPRAVTEPRASTAVEHILFYDAVCPLCSASVEELRRRGLLAGIEARAIEDAPALGLSPERAEALRSELLLWSRASGSGASGFDGLLKLLEIQGKWRLLQTAFRLPPLRELGRFGYRLTSFNRRILSPPATGGAACACDPPDRPRWRQALLAVLLAIAVGGTFLFGMALSTCFHGSSPLRMGLLAALTAGCSWAVSAAFAAVGVQRRFRDVLWQGLVVLAIGIAVLAPFAFAAWLLTVLGVTPVAGLLVHITGLVLSILTMLRATIRRHRNLGFPRWTPWLWFAGMWVGAAPFLIG
jgi:predicted DCC family thiol-disulfide oxidoreductase YuxK